MTQLEKIGGGALKFSNYIVGIGVLIALSLILKSAPAEADIIESGPIGGTGSCDSSACGCDCGSCGSSSASGSGGCSGGGG